MEVKSLVQALELEETGPRSYRAWSVPHDSGRPVVEGAQMLAQMMVAAGRSDEAKRVRSAHALFARVGNTTEPLDVSIDVVHSGRSLSSIRAEVRQVGRVLTAALIMLDAGERDVIHHELPMPVGVDPPATSAPYLQNSAGTEVRIAGGVNLAEEGHNGPAELFVWYRVPGAPPHQVTNQALLCARSHLFLIAAAMRPHEGIGIGLAHQSLSTGVISHAMDFHREVDVSAWHLLAQQGVYAGGGRAYGRGDIFAEDGRQIASFTQQALIREFHPDFERRDRLSLTL